MAGDAMLPLCRMELRRPRLVRGRLEEVDPSGKTAAALRLHRGAAVPDFSGTRRRPPSSRPRSSSTRPCRQAQPGPAWAFASQMQAGQAHAEPQQAQPAWAFASVASARRPRNPARARAAIIPNSPRRIIFGLLFVSPRESAIHTMRTAPAPRFQGGGGRPARRRPSSPSPGSRHRARRRRGLAQPAIHGAAAQALGVGEARQPRRGGVIRTGGVHSEDRGVSSAAPGRDVVVRRRDPCGPVFAGRREIEGPGSIPCGSQPCSGPASARERPVAASGTSTRRQGPHRARGNRGRDARPAPSAGIVEGSAVAGAQHPQADAQARFAGSIIEQADASPAVHADAQSPRGRSVDREDVGASWPSSVASAPARSR